MRDRCVRILIIDDDEDDLAMFKSMIAEVRGDAWTVEWTPSYALGLQAIESHAHDICFLDYRLGLHTGLELLRAAVSAGCRMPIVLLTGYGEDDVDHEAMRAGAADYLIKDQISAKGLERCIRYAVHRAEMLGALRDREAQVLMQDRLASVGLLASSLAHEIGTPLGVIRGRAEFLAFQMGDNEIIQKNATIIITQIDRVSALIRTLLDLARGDGLRPRTAVTLNSVTGEIVDLMEQEFARAGIEFRNSVSDAVGVFAERSALHQILLNLIVNSTHAIQSAAAQGRAAGHFIRMTAFESAGGWSIAIQDSGCGISEANRRHLFKPFFTTKDVGSGTGLGLVTCYRIIKSWGGTIEVESQQGVGTKFRVFLPHSTHAAHAAGDPK